MVRINKKLFIKYKLSISVFEALNQKAYATQSRALGTTSKVINSLLADLTFCDTILPIIVGNNNKNADWEREKQNYLSSVQLSIPSSGYPLDLNSTFDVDSSNLGKYIAEYIKENAEDLYTKSTNKEETEPVLKSEKEIAKHILDNDKVKVIDYHKYFKFDNANDYLYWTICDLSNQVANTTEDVDKSPNIRFFLFDEKVVRQRYSDKIDKEMEATDKLKSIKTETALLKNIALYKNILTLDELEEIDDKQLYIDMYNFAKNSPDEFIDIVKDKDVKLKSDIRKYIEVGILYINDSGDIVDADNQSIVLGASVEDAVKYLKLPTNSGELNKFSNKYKSLKK